LAGCSWNTRATRGCRVISTVSRCRPRWYGGEDDQLTPAGQSKLWRRLIPHAKISIFKGAGHLVLDEKPEAVKAIAEFLA